MARVDYTPRFLTATYLERERDNPLRLGVYRDGAIVTPASGSLKVYDAGNTLITTETVVVSSSFATATVESADLTSKSLSSGWRVEWHLVMPDTYTHVFRNAAALCRVAPSPPASIEDLLEEVADLGSYIPATQTTWQPQVDKAWADITLWLEGKGRRPYLVIDGNALRPWHTYASLEKICGILGGDGDESNRWVKLEAKYAKKAEHARDNLTLEYDETDSGAADSRRKVGAQPVIFLCDVGEEAW